MARKISPLMESRPAVPRSVALAVLPRPQIPGSSPLDMCLQTRRSARQFAGTPVSMAEVSQLLWAGQGVTALGGLRTAPSAGALYAIKTYLAAAGVRGLTRGMYQYDADENHLRFLLPGDLRPALLAAGVDVCTQDAAALMVLAADYRRPTREFGENARRLVHIEAGHIGQNVCLEATALGLGVIGLGAFRAEEVRQALHLSEHQEPVYVLAFGKKPGDEVS